MLTVVTEYGTTDAHAKALALLTQSRRAKNASGLLHSATSWAAVRLM